MKYTQRHLLALLQSSHDFIGNPNAEIERSQFFAYLKAMENREAAWIKAEDILKPYGTLMIQSEEWWESALKIWVVEVLVSDRGAMKSDNYYHDVIYGSVLFTKYSGSSGDSAHLTNIPADEAETRMASWMAMANKRLSSRIEKMEVVNFQKLINKYQAEGYLNIQDKTPAFQKALFEWFELLIKLRFPIYENKLARKNWRELLRKYDLGVTGKNRERTLVLHKALIDWLDIIIEHTRISVPRSPRTDLMVDTPSFPLILIRRLVQQEVFLMEKKRR